MDDRRLPGEHKFARPEWERRFLLARLPENERIVRVRQIVDRYFDGTTLRLRRRQDSDGKLAFRLTQKLPQGARDAFQGLITTIELAEQEYDILASLPSRVLIKTRYSVPPFGIDVFEGELSGLVMAEAEFESLEQAAALRLPPFLTGEVSTDPRFTGARLAAATRQELKEWLAEFGLVPSYSRSRD